MGPRSLPTFAGRAPYYRRFCGLLGVNQLVTFLHDTNVAVRKGAVESDAVAITLLHKIQSRPKKVTQLYS